MGSKEEDIESLISEIENIVKLEDSKPLNGSDSIKIKKGNKMIPMNLEDKQKVSQSLNSIYEEWLKQDD